jgi:hypothetical protein
VRRHHRCGRVIPALVGAQTAARVLLVDGELPGAALQERLAQIVESIDITPAGDMLRIIAADLLEAGVPDLATAEGQAWINSYLTEIDVLILDNVSTLFRIAENDADEWTAAQAWALALRRRGIAVIFVHHDGKGGLQRGTSKREDVLDTVIQLKNPDGYTPLDGARFEVNFKKSRGFWGNDAAPFEAALAEDETRQLVWTTRETTGATKRDRARELAAAGTPQRAIAERLRVSQATVSRWL